MKRTFLTVMVVVIVASILLIIVKWWKAIPPIIGGWNFAILNLLELVGPVIALSLASFILYQFIRHFFRPQLIFEGFSNASNLDKSSAGLKMMSFNELTLEELSNQSKILSKMWNQSDGVLLEDRSWKNRIPINFINDDSVISRLSRTDIFDWIRSSEDKVPQGFAFIMSFMSFVGDTIAPIIKIAGHLQYRSDNRAGITLEVADTKKPGNYTIYTFWQDEVSVADKIVDSYIELLSPAMRWLAMVLLKQNVESHINIRNFFSGNRKREKAILLYRLGTLFYSSTKEFTKHKSTYLQLAINYLRQAIDTNQNWYYPSLYLANIYSLEMEETKDEAAYKKKFSEALKLFDKALVCAKSTHEGIDTLQRILLARMLMELTSDIRTFNERHIREVLAPQIAAIKEYIDSDSFDFERADSAAFLYNLATWYGLAYNSMAFIPNVDTKKEAQRYLAFCLALSDNLRDKVENDENFKFLRDEGDLEILKEELAMHKDLTEKAERARMTGVDFRAEIGNILERIDKKLGRI